jgi:hypothetical protein
VEERDFLIVEAHQDGGDVVFADYELVAAKS